METQIKIKLCKVCGNSSEFHKFKGLLCCKCASRKNNKKLGNEYYNNIMKARYVKHGQVGRPKKIISDDEIKIKKPRGRPKIVLVN